MTNCEEIRERFAINWNYDSKIYCYYYIIKIIV